MILLNVGELVEWVNLSSDFWILVSFGLSKLCDFKIDGNAMFYLFYWARKLNWYITAIAIWCFQNIVASTVCSGTRISKPSAHIHSSSALPSTLTTATLFKSLETTNSLLWLSMRNIMKSSLNSCLTVFLPMHISNVVFILLGHFSSGIIIIIILAHW